MTMQAALPPRDPSKGRRAGKLIYKSLAWNEVVLGVALACTSGAAVLAHTFGPLPMSLTVPFVVMPSVAIIGGVVLLRSRLTARFHLLADLMVLGAWTGAVATVGYDLVRVILKMAFGFHFNPFAAIPIFGQLMTGTTVSTPLVLTFGWVYHFWNGMSFGMMFAIFRPRGGMISGLVWGLGLAVLMLVTYPNLLHVNPEDPGFLTADLIGHAVWGIVLGEGVRRWGPYARA